MYHPPHRALTFRRCLACAAAPLLLALFTLGGASPLLFAGEPASAAETDSAPADWSPVVERLDLARAFVRLESAYLSAQFTRERQIEVNRRFDGVAREFMKGGFTNASRMLDRLALEIAAGQPVTPRLAWLAGLRVRTSPAVWPRDTHPPLTVWLESTYPIEDLAADEPPLAIEAALIDGQGRRSLTQRLEVVPQRLFRTTWSIDAPPEDLATGRQIWKLSAGTDLRFDAGLLTIVPRSLDAQRAEHAARLEKLATEGPLRDAIATCAARNRWLSDTPSRATTVSFATDLSVLAMEVAAEIAELEAGRNPYRGRRGDHWRIAKGKTSEIPLRVYVPEKLPADQPQPLLIVLHGAGGDENLFFFGYAQGLIKRLADEHGLIVASPLTYSILGNSKNFDVVLDALERDYSIDPKRVYVLGHSLGALTAAQLASERGSRITAACLLAGLPIVTADSIPPLSVFSAELDRIIPAAFIRPAAARIADQGLPIEYVDLKDLGHTMMVVEALPRGVKWLADQKRPAGKEAAIGAE